jgi:hypothetical protein
VEPPAFLVLTGTLLLPFPRVSVSEEYRRLLLHEERDLWWNPQRHLDDGPTTAHRLSEEKVRWIGELANSSQERRERFERIRYLTAELRPFVAEEERRTRASLEETDHGLQVQRVQARRDYAFCLYPEEVLRRFYRQVLD